MANLTLHFPENFGGDTTQIYYIGLRGEATQVFSHKYHMGTSFLVRIVMLTSFLMLITTAVEEGCCSNNCL